MSIKSAISALGFILLINISAVAVTPSQVKFGDIANDTTEITKILIENYNREGHKPGELMVKLGENFIDVPYEAGTLDGIPEELTVNLQGMDCMSFVENVMALAITLNERRSSWIDFVYNLENIRYRNGNLNGYSSRLHYFSDWVVDNSHRGHIADVTARIANPSYQDAQVGYRSHRYPYIKSTNVESAGIQPGDIIAVTTKIPGLDVSHVGIAVKVKGKIHLLHASSKEGKVCVSSLPLTEYLRRNRNATGIRVIRLTE